ncbi:TetR/AcrR family transcriptional regulator [bacterium]|nr:TetR/AcrR family transcriptional regulator [bacterium]
MKVENDEIIDLVFVRAKTAILNKGLNNLNMDELAKECKLAKATLYKIIGSKADLVSKIALYFYDNTFAKFYNYYLESPSFEKLVAESMLSLEELSVGKLRILVNEIYVEYPFIKVRIEEYLTTLEERFYLLFKRFQDEGKIIADINIKLLIEIIRETLQTSIYSQDSDKIIKEKINIFNTLIIRGLQK